MKGCFHVLKKTKLVLINTKQMSSNTGKLSTIQVHTFLSGGYRMYMKHREKINYINYRLSLVKT